MSDYQTFSVDQFDAGAFDRDGRVHLDFDKRPALLVGGRAVIVAVKGEIRLRVTWSGWIDTDKHEVDTLFGSYETETPKPPPHVGLQVRTDAASVTLRNPTDAARALFDALAPEDLAVAAAGLAGALHGLVDGDSGAIFGRLADAVSLDKFPFWDVLPGDLRDAVRSKARDAAAPYTAPLQGLLDGAIAAQRDLVAAAITACAHTIVQQLGDALEKATRFLLLVGTPWRDVLHPLVDALSAAVADGRALDDLGWLIDLLRGIDGAFLDQTLARLLVAARGRWDAVAPAVRDLLARAADGRAAAFAAHLLAGVAASDAVARDLAGAGRMLVGLHGLLLDLVGGAWAVAAPWLGDLLARAEQAHADLGAFLQPLFDARTFTKQAALDLLRNLGPSAIVKQACTWMAGAWSRIRHAFTEAADEIGKAIELIAGLARDFPEKLMDELHQLTGLFRWASDLPHVISDGEELPRLVDRVTRLRQQVGAGAPLSAIVGEEAGPDVAARVRSLATDNDLVRLCRGVRRHTERYLGQTWSDARGKPFPDNFIAAIDDLDRLSQYADDLVFAGGAGEGPFTAGIGYYQVETGALAGEGASIDPGETTQSAALSDLADFDIGVTAPTIPNVMGFVALWGKREQMVIPEPSSMLAPSPIPHEGLQVASYPSPAPGLAPCVALAHLPEFYVIDLRYHMPYGDYASFTVADLDNDGFVREWEIDAVRRAVGGPPSNGLLDSDSDGSVTATDVQLATEQRDLYVNEVMYRRTTGPLAVFVQMSPKTWFFVALASLKDESIPGKLERRGYLSLVEGQIAIGDGDASYPIRFHLEARAFLDVFTGLAPFGILPPPVNPSERYDLVLRCGEGGRDVQLYFEIEPINLMARTWIVRASTVLNGIITGAYFGVAAESGAGLAGKGDLRLSVVYECKEPLAETLGALADAAEKAGELGKDFKDTWKKSWRDPAGPLYFLASTVLKQAAESTDVPKLVRAILRAVAPFLDLLFGWTDPTQDVSGVLGHVRNRYLLGMTPGITWGEVRDTVAGWGADVCPGDLKRLILTAMRDERDALGHVDEDVCWAIGRVVARLGAAPMPDAVKAYLTRRWLCVLPADRLLGEPEWGGVTLGPTALFGAVKVDGREIGTHQMKRPMVWNWDKKTIKGLFATAVRLGANAYVYTAPIADLLYIIDPATPAPHRENQLATVEAGFALVDAANDLWLYVRTETRAVGWVHFNCDWRDLLASDESGDHAGLFDDTLQALRKDASRPPLAIVELRASPPETVDDTLAAGRARAMIESPTPDPAMHLLFRRVRDWVKFRILYDFRDKLGKQGLTDDILAKVWNGLSHHERQAFWLQISAEVKAAYYFVKVSEQIGGVIAYAIANDDLRALWQGFTDMMGRSTANFQRDYVLPACEASAPAIVDVVKSLFAVIGHILGAAKKAFKAVHDTHSTKDTKRTESKLKQALAHVAATKMLTDGDIRALALILAQRIREELPSWVQAKITDAVYDYEFEKKPDEPDKDFSAFGVGLDGVDVGKGHQTQKDGATTYKSTMNLFHADLDGFAVGQFGLSQTTKRDNGPTDTTSGDFTFAEYDGDNIEFGKFDLAEQIGKEKDDKDETASGSVSIDVGKDTLTLTWSVEGGGGGGGGDGQAGATATGGVKVYGYMAKIPVKSLLTVESLAIALRFFLRFLYHSTDAMAMYAQYQADGGDDGANALGEKARVLVFLLFAVKEALSDLIDDHAKWVVDFLEGTDMELQLDVNGSILGTLGGHVDVNATVKGKVAISLATVMAPIVDFLTGDAGSLPNAASAADLIEPNLRISVDDNFCVKVGAPFGSIEVESTGPLCAAKLSIPKGSSLRAWLHGWMAWAARAAEDYRRRKLAQTSTNPSLDPVRAVLEDLDATIVDLLLSGSDGDSDPVDSISHNPHVCDIYSALTGLPRQAHPSDEDMPVQMQKALAALADARPIVRGVPAWNGNVLEAEASGSVFVVSLYCTTDERNALAAAGFVSPQSHPPKQALEDAACAVVLPSAPREVGWNDRARGGDKHVAGIIAGFDLRDDAEAFAAARSGDWMEGAGDLADDVWQANDRFWVWVETGLVPKLEKQSCPLPALALDGARLTATFTRITPGSAAAAKATVFSGVTWHTDPVWKVPLVSEATRADYRALAARLALNNAQPG